jgi:hypothetical protein
MLVTSAALVLCGCSSSVGSASRNPWRSTILAAAKNANSSFERQVLADGTITKAEYQEAVHRYVACAQDHGLVFDAAIQTSGLYQYSLSGQTAASATSRQPVLDGCARGTTALIEPLYGDLVQNPNKKDLMLVFAECFVRKGVAPHGYSSGDFKRDAAANFVNPSLNARSPFFAACLQNPSTP